MRETTRRTFSAIQLGLGVCTVGRPSAMVDALTPAGSAVPPRWIVRVLGLRQVVQGTVGIVRPTSSMVAWGAAVDASHALSLVPLIVFSRRYRAAAAASGGLAVGAALVGIALADR